MSAPRQASFKESGVGCSAEIPQPWAECWGTGAGLPFRPVPQSVNEEQSQLPRIVVPTWMERLGCYTDVRDEGEGG